MPLEDVAGLFAALLETLGLQAACAPLLALALAWRVEECHAVHPKAEAVLEAVPAMLGACAEARGIDGEEVFEAWLKALLEPDREALERRLDIQLEVLASDGWLFDPKRVG